MIRGWKSLELFFWQWSSNCNVASVFVLAVRRIHSFWSGSCHGWSWSCDSSGRCAVLLRNCCCRRAFGRYCRGIQGGTNGYVATMTWLAVGRIHPFGYSHGSCVLIGVICILRSLSRHYSLVLLRIGGFGERDNICGAELSWGSNSFLQEINNKELAKSSFIEGFINVGFGLLISNIVF